MVLETESALESATALATSEAKSARTDLIEAAASVVGGRGGRGGFVVDLFGRVPPEDLAAYAPGTLAELAAAAFAHLKAPRPAGGPDLRLVDLEVERGGRRRDVTVLEVVNDNMPFLLDSTLAEIVDQGYEPILVAHPILAVERDAAGALVRLVGETTRPPRRGR